MNTNERLKKHQPIEVWATSDKSWIWEVYRKYQKPANELKNPYARWFCRVLSPIVGYDNGELGDTYVVDIKKYSRKIYDETDGKPYK